MYPYHFRVIPLYNESAITFRDESFVDFLSLAFPLALKSCCTVALLFSFMVYTIRVSNSLDLGQARHFVMLDLGSNCLQGYQQTSQ